MPVISFKEKTPTVSASAFVAPDAWIIGDVSVGDDVSIFFNVVLRGDIEKIAIGRGSNLQEHVLVHTSHGMNPATVGEDVTVGHRAIIHGCTIEDRCLIGMGATLLNGARIGEGCLVGACALITEGKQIAQGSLVMGAPGKVVRQLDDIARARLLASAAHYQANAARFAQGLRQIGQ